MAKVVLVAGGARSGKSEYARRMAETFPAPRVFVATGAVVDDEMRERVRKHREARAGRNWETIEETENLETVLRGARRFNVLLVDCLTLWIGNVMHAATGAGKTVGEEEIARRCRDLLGVCAGLSGTVVFVTGEVGMGVVPEHPVSRRFRDLLGTCNRIMAEGANEATLVVCGLPLHLKKGGPE
jgi:adenosylcobinamide kinase/adenosylcobinamide-phosphate guanylyltransferase